MDGMFPQDEHEAIARANEHVGIGEPRAFQNFLYGTGMYAARTATEAVKTLDLAGAVVPIMLDKLTGGTERQDQYFAENDRLQKVVDYFTPEPGEVGWASQALGSVAGGLPLIIAAPAIGIPALGMSSSADLIKEGVSPAVAGTVGAINSAALAVGLKIPFIGKTLSSQLASGIAGNWGLGVAATATSKAVLLGSENFKQAEELNPFDAKRQAMDVLMGAAFGTFAHLGMKAQAKVEAERDAIFTQATKDALLALNQAYHLEDVAMPGKSDNPFAINQGVKAVRQAMDQMLNDEPVNVEQLTPLMSSMRPSAAKQAYENAAAAEGSKQAKIIINEILLRNEALRVAQETPGFQRTPEQLVALRKGQTRPEEAPNPEVARAIEISNKQGFLRTAEEKIFLDNVLSGNALDHLLKPIPEARPNVVPEAPLRYEPAKEPVSLEISRRLAATPDDEVPPQGWKDVLKKIISSKKVSKDEISASQINKYVEANPDATKQDVLTVLKEKSETLHLDGQLSEQPKALAALNEITGTDNATLVGHQGLEAAITASGGETEALSKLAERGITNIRSEQPEGPLTIPTKPTPPPGSAVAAVPSDPIVDTVQRLIGENPDMLVPVGKDENSKTITMKASEYMAKATQDAEAAKTDAGVFRTAITCMLGML